MADLLESLRKHFSAADARQLDKSIRTRTGWWLTQFSDDHGVERYVDEFFQQHFHRVIAKAAGLRVHLGDWDIMGHHSEHGVPPLALQMRQLAADAAAAWIERYTTPPELPTAQIKAIKKHYRDAYVQELFRAAGEAGTSKAREDVGATLTQFLEDTIAGAADGNPPAPIVSINEEEDR